MDIIPRTIRGRRGLLLICAATGILLAGCDRDGQDPPGGKSVPRSGGVLRILSEPPQCLDPIASDEVYEAVVLRQIYEGLVTLDAGLRVQPALASSWTISPDGLLYTFRLRPGVHFHDGADLTAYEVAASIERCVSPHRDTDCLAGSYLMQIRGAEAYRAGRSPHLEGIHIADERSLEIELIEPQSIFLKVLAMEQTAAIARGLLDHADERFIAATPTGTGPFRFVRREPDGSVVLARFDGYWGPKAFLDSLIFRPVPDEGEAAEEASAGRPNELTALMRGVVQFAELPTGASPSARAAGLSVYRSPELSVSFLGLRCDLPPFNDPEVRAAVFLAIHRDSLTAIDPEGKVPVSGLLPPGMPGRDPADHMPEADPDAARGLLAKAGHPGGRGLPPVTINVSTGSSSARLARPIVADLKAVGIDARLRRMNWNDLDRSAVEGKLQAFLMSWVADLPDPDAFLFPLFHADGQSNLFAYRCAATDSLLDRGRTLAPGPERNRVYALLQDRILEDAPMIPLYHSSLAYAWKPEVKGIEIGPCGFALVPFSRVYLERRDGDLRRSSWP